MPRRNRKSAKPKEPAAPRRKPIGRGRTQKRGRKNPATMSAADRKDLATARRLATRFHGSAEGHVLELSPKERRPAPRFVAVVGTVDDMTYDPGDESKRGFAKWKHESGDRGPGRPKASKKPLLVVGADQRPAIVAHGSPMKFSSNQGLVG